MKEETFLRVVRYVVVAAALMILLKCLSTAISADPPKLGKIVFPVPPQPTPPPQPPAPPGTPVVITADLIYVVNSDVPLIVIASPDGLVQITEEAGPLRIRGRFVDAPNKVQTRKLTAAHLYFVDAVQSGRCELLAWPTDAKDAGAVARQLIECNIGPLPPPVPPVPPVPPSPAPIPVVGFRVLIVYDAKAILPSEQTAAMAAESVRDYLREKCVKVGNQPEFRMFKHDENLANASKLWQDAMKRPRTSLPWLIISDGTKGFEGPLPKNTADLLAKLKEIGG